MEIMMREYGDEVNETIKVALSRCAFQIGVDLTPSQVSLIVEDIIEKYKLDSVEDVVEALKKGRRGNYGTTYNSLNMIIISKWMGFHLEEKARAREQLISFQREIKVGELNFNQEYSKRLNANFIKKEDEKIIKLMQQADTLINENVDFDRIKFINEIMTFFKYYRETKQYKSPPDRSLILDEFRKEGIIQGKIKDENEAIKQVFDSLIESGMDINDVIK